MNRRLPPLNSLRAFEAAGRALSLSKAAEELNVTPAAVSQQVKILEESLGAKLFRRAPRALFLTEAGQVMLPLVTEGLDKLAEAAERVGSQEKAGALTVSVSPSFAAKWLVPRLERFRRVAPQIDVRVEASDRLVDFTRNDVDIGVRYGRGRYPGLETLLMFDDRIAPACSPALLEGEHPLRTPEDLRHHTLLHVDWKVELDSAPNWGMWLRAAGLTDIPAERGPRFTMEALAVQAAIDGQGVVLAQTAMTDDDVASGRLARPFDPSLSRQANFSYFLVYPPAYGKRPHIQAFRDWILEESAGL